MKEGIVAVHEQHFTGYGDEFHRIKLFDHGDKIGSITWWPADHDHIPTGEIWIYNFEVSENRRREGFGAFLLEEATEEAKARGFTKALLTVHTKNRAAKMLYLKTGWKFDNEIIPSKNGDDECDPLERYALDLTC